MLRTLNSARRHLGIALAATLTASLAPAPAVIAYGPDGDDTPGAIDIDPEIIYCRDDPNCRQNTCAGPDVIFGPQPETCVPCLPNSSAHAFNKICECNPGYRVVRTDDWGRVSCVVDRGDEAPPAANVQTIAVPAAEFHHAVADLGAPPLLSVPPHHVCRVITPGSDGAVAIEMYMEVPPLVQDNLPLPQDPNDIICSGIIFGTKLVNGWTFAGLGQASVFNCNNFEFSDGGISKSTSDPTDMTHSFFLKEWGLGNCAIEIGTVNLTGPQGQHWKTSLGH